jgi:hypothetical protein
MFSFFSQRRLQMLLHRLKEFPFEQVPNFDWEDSIPLEELQRWLRLREKPERHPVARSLRTLIETGSSYEENVSLRQIGAITASRGAYRMHLDRLPETMYLNKGESYGPLSDSEMERLKDAVFREFGIRDGRFVLWFQEWDQLYVGVNSGASRRFALWRRLCSDCRPVQVPATVTPYRLKPEPLRDLLEGFRAIGIKANWKLPGILNDAGETSKEFAYLDAEFPYQSDWAMLLIPYPHRFPKEQAHAVLELHRRLDLFFDLGRYLVERMSVAAMRMRR